MWLNPELSLTVNIHSLNNKYLSRVKQNTSGNETHLMDRIAVRIYSELLGCYLWVAADDRDEENLRSQGKKETIYTKEEIRKILAKE